MQPIRHRKLLTRVQGEELAPGRALLLERSYQPRQQQSGSNDHDTNEDLPHCCTSSSSVKAASSQRRSSASITSWNHVSTLVSQPVQREIRSMASA